MSFKLAFRFKRNNYSPEAMREGDEEIKRNLKIILDTRTVNFNHMYPPARNSIKVIFPSESEIEKILAHPEHFIENHYEPKMSLTLKANRTIFLH